jgi:hypothetical protein
MSTPKPGRGPRPYARTLGDRLGADAGRYYKAVVWGMAGGVMFFPLGLLFGPGWQVLITVPLAVLLGGSLIAAVSLFLSGDRAVAAVTYYVAPTGSSTPYEEQFSQEDALVMQERIGDALALFEQRIADDPAAIRPRIRAADLYAGLGRNPQRAAELFREVQRIPGLTSGQDVYAGNRLVDLYMGPLALPGRALVELRRLVDRYPDSRVAPHLREAIATLKARHTPETPEP